MKLFYILVMTLMVAIQGSSQTTYYWQPAAGGSWSTANNWSTSVTGIGGTSRNTPATTDILIIDKGTSMNINSIPSQTIGRLTILSGTVTLSAPTGSQTLTISNGTGNDFVVSSGATVVQDISLENIVLQVSSTADIAGTYQIGGIYNISAGNTITTVTGAIDNRNTITGASASRLIFNGSTYFHGQNGGNIPSATWNAGSTLDLSGMTTQCPGNMGQNFRTVKFSSNLIAPVTLGSDLTCLEDLSINLASGTTYDLRLTSSNANRSVTVGRNFSLISGSFSLDNDNGGSVLNIAGNFFQSGGNLTETSTGSATVNFNGTTLQSFSKTSGTISQTINFNINANAIVDFGTAVLDGSTSTFNLANGGKIITSNTSGINSSGALGTIQVGGSRTFGNGADYEFHGALTGTFITPGNQVRDLIINNTTTNEVLAERIFLVNGALILASGHLTTSAGQVTIGASGSATTNNGAFVNGSLAKNTNSITSFTFPVGNTAGGLRTIGINTTDTTSSVFTAQFFRAAPPTGNLDPTLMQISACEYWDLSRPSGSPAHITLSWGNNSSCKPGPYVTQVSSLRVAHLTGGVWVNEGFLSGTGDNVAGTITSANAVNSFSPFTLGSNTRAENPLPVLFANEKAYESNNVIQIEWSNMTEKDVATYTVERSQNGNDFTAIRQLLPTNNQNDKADYTAFDANPAQGANYYRIKAIETSGKIVYSKILRVSMGSTIQSLRLYPNPVKGNQVTINLSNVKLGQYTLRVFNTAGQDIFRQTINNQSSSLTQTLDLPVSIKAGVYKMVITGSDYRETKTFIVQ